MGLSRLAARVRAAISSTFPARPASNRAGGQEPREDESMRRFQVIAMGGAVLLSGWMLTEAARAADEGEKAVRKPGKRVEVMRMLGGGGRLGVSLEEVGADDVGRLKLAGERGAVVTEVQEGSA